MCKRKKKESMTNHNHKHKDEDEDKIIVTAKMNFPFEFYAATLFFIFIFFVIIGKIVSNEKPILEWFLLLGLSLIIFIGIITIGRSQYKRFVVYENKIIIRPIFSIKPIIIHMNQLRGFELFETTVFGGFDFNIRLVTLNEDKILFPKDRYSNYDKILNGLHKSKLQYLGQKEYNKKYKKEKESILKWSAILLPIIYGLFLLLRTLK
jgi:hypothetical protein